MIERIDSGPTRWALSLHAFDSAYAGSMSAREDGGYIRRDDAHSLATALLNLIRSGDRAAEDAAAALKEARGELNELRDIAATIELGLQRGYKPAELLDENSPVRDRIRAAIAKPTGGAS